MAYIGKSPTGTGVRSRYYFTATGGETSLSGADDNSNTLVFSDGNYVDVSLNGIALVAGTDYNTSTANTIAGLSALSASDIVEIVVYDIFTVADTVSAKDGGTFSGNVAMGGTLSVTGASTLTGAATATGGLNVGTIKEATGTTTAMTIDSNGTVLMPQKPAWRVSLSANQSVSVSGYTQVELDLTSTENCFLNGGVTISSYEVVAPVTGIYAVNSYVRLDNIGSGYVQLGILVNGVRSGISDTFVLDGDPATDYTSLSASDVFSVTANDTFKLEIFSSADQAYIISRNTVFSGHLVG